MWEETCVSNRLITIIAGYVKYFSKKTYFFCFFSKTAFLWGFQAKTFFQICSYIIPIQLQLWGLNQYIPTEP